MMEKSKTKLAEWIRLPKCFCVINICRLTVLSEMIGKNCQHGLRQIVTSIGKKPVVNFAIKSFEEIPGPRPLPLIGNLWRYFPVIGTYSYDRIHETYAKMHEEFGPLVKEKVFGDKILIHVFDPVDMRNVYEADGNNPVRISHTALANYRKARPHLYSGAGLFPSNGEEWRHFRSMFQKLLLHPSTVDECSNILEDITDEMVSKIPNCLDENNEMNLQPLLFNWALECIGAVTLNRRLGCLSAEGNKEAQSLITAANDTHTAVYRTEMTPYSVTSYKKLEDAQNLHSSVVEKYLDGALEDFNQKRNQKCLAVKMLQLEGATRRDVFTMILDMFMAGIDTTAFTLSFCLHNLARNTDVQEKLRQEVTNFSPKPNSRFTDISLKHYPYLRALVKETLRTNPISIGTGRIIQKDLALSGYLVPAQSFTVLQHQVASMHEKYFPNPHKFEPERWLRREFTPLVSSPFGYGGRMCVGKKIADRELYLAISKLVRTFHITYHYEKIDSVNRLINVPDKPLRLRLTKVSG
ncbi:probable cytochrome P450 49a1 [Caerostris darwini]|uniref:Probable cytochrome P450 49a1 n=1 Tax=Caerostris darwini TaxID=1538125 RepID=A0AAV4QKN6_9ARAC|nr:probable cytochrome P450 49a1 [Caerostris darwini]